MAAADNEELVEIGIDDLGKFKIGKISNGLYFDGKRVQTESVIVLSGAQSRWAIGVAVAAVLSAATTIFVNAKTVFWDAPKPAMSAADSAALAEIAHAATTIGINAKLIADSHKPALAHSEHSP